MSESEDNDEMEQNDNVHNISVFRKRDKIDMGSDQKIGVESLNKLDRMLTCPICLDIFTDPVYVKGCSHRFCRDCIEKAIRSSKMKQCPTCRKIIGTKRMLRLDRNVQQIMTLIYGDVPKFIADKNLNDNQMVEKFYKDKGLSQPDTTHIKKKRKVIEKELKLEEEIGEQDRQSTPPALPPPPTQSASRNLKIKEKKNFMLNEEDEEQDFQPKQVSIRQSKFIKEELKERETSRSYKKLKRDEIIREDEDEEEEDEIEALLGKDIKPMLITIQIKVIPYQSLQKQYDLNICKLDWRLTLADITKLICSQLGINHSKYSPYLKFYTKSNQQDTFYHPLEDKSQRIKTVEENFWSSKGRYKYIREYSKQEQLKNLKEEYIHQKAAESRILYYMIEVQELPEFKIV